MVSGYQLWALTLCLGGKIRTVRVFLPLQQCCGPRLRALGTSLCCEPLTERAHLSHSSGNTEGVRMFEQHCLQAENWRVPQIWNMPDVLNYRMEWWLLQCLFHADKKRIKAQSCLKKVNREYSKHPPSLNSKKVLVELGQIFFFLI